MCDLWCVCSCMSVYLCLHLCECTCVPYDSVCVTLCLPNSQAPDSQNSKSWLHPAVGGKMPAAWAAVLHSCLPGSQHWQPCLSGWLPAHQENWAICLSQAPAFPHRTLRARPDYLFSSVKPQSHIASLLPPRPHPDRPSIPALTRGPREGL